MITPDIINRAHHHRDELALCMLKLHARARGQQIAQTERGKETDETLSAFIRHAETALTEIQNLYFELQELENLCTEIAGKKSKYFTGKPRKRINFAK